MFLQKSGGSLTHLLSTLTIILSSIPHHHPNQAPFVQAVANGLALTPAMGWNNWNSLGCLVSEALLISTAQNLVSLGLRDVGYDYVVLDDCWSDGRDPHDGKMRADREKFPHGMKWIADRVHEQGLLWGMYSSAGHMTCARYEGSLDHEVDDANSFAEWEVDYLKYDNCYAEGRLGSAEVSFKRYDAMAQALNATGRPILYSLCNWGEDFVNSWGVSIANSWRVSGDIYDSFARPDDLCSCTVNDPSNPFCVAPGSRCSVLSIINRVAPYANRGQSGGWQDLDMLEVGVGGMSDEEYKAHFSLWAALKSPLLIGADIRELSASALSILNNPAIIAVNQDSLGRPATRVSRNLTVPKDRFEEGETQVWSGPLHGGDQLVILLNAANEDQEMVAYLEDIFVSDGPGCSAAQCAESWDVNDLWATRMEDQTAQRIVEGAKLSKSAVDEIYDSIGWFNSTMKSYNDALEERDPRLFGSKVAEVEAYGSLKTWVPRHAAKVFRLQSKSEKTGLRYNIHMGEL